MAKGGQFERDFSRDLSLWWTKGKRDDIFWRTAGSGARATVRTKQGKSTAGQYGDITATDPVGKLLIDNILFELKNGYPEAEIEKLINYSLTKKNAAAGTDLYSKWIEKCEKSCKASKIPGWMIVHKRANREPLITMNLSAFFIVAGRGTVTRTFEPIMSILMDNKTFYRTIRLEQLFAIDSDEVKKCLRNSN